MKYSVYIETTVIGHYASRISANPVTAAHQKLTIEWWENVKPRFLCFISPFVYDEIRRGDPEEAEKRVRAVSDLMFLEENEEIHGLAEMYLSRLNIPERAEYDAFHIAAAVWHEMDFLLTWNCTHISNAMVIKVVQEINDELNIRTPVICTPEELLVI